MAKIVPVVEGDGEVEAAPILLRKLLDERQRWDVQIARPKNTNGRGNLTKPGGLERFVQVAWLEPDCGTVLVLIDADKDCARELAEGFARRIQAIGVRRSVVVVVAACEYEAWFLASLETIAGRDLQGRPGLPAGLQYPQDVEAIVGVKGWLSRQFPGGRIYKESLDQAPMTRLLDTTRVRERSRSFRRLCHAIEQALEAIDSGQVIVTPLVISDK